jgi:hypothetical protein
MCDPLLDEFELNAPLTGAFFIRAWSYLVLMDDHEGQASYFIGALHFEDV